jgi:hypothetical protein
LLVERKRRLLLPEMIDVGVARDLEEPDVEPALAEVAGPVLQDADEDLLDEVFARGPVTRQAEEEVEEHGLVSLEEDGQLLDAAVPDVFHQLVVGR